MYIYIYMYHVYHTICVILYIIIIHYHAMHIYIITIMYKSTSRSGCPMVPVSEANENPGLTIQESVRSGPKFRGFQMV